MTATTDPRLLVVTTGATPLQGTRDYSYIGYYPGVLQPTGARFFSAPVKKAMSLNVGVSFPYAIRPIEFKV